MNRNSDKPNYYQVLEVAATASQEVIRAAYKTLMQKYHPDLQRSVEVSNEKVLLIREAYDVLSDEEKRELYDKDVLGVGRGEDSSPVAADDDISREHSVVHASKKNNSTVKQVNMADAIWPVVILSGLIVIASLVDDKKKDVGSTSAINSGSENKELILVQELEHRYAAEEKMKKMEEMARDEKNTIVSFVNNLRVKMPEGFGNCGNEVFECKHEIHIPRVDLILHEKDAEKIAIHIKENKLILIDSIENSLRSKNFKEFASVDGEERLSIFIAYELNAIVLGDDFKGGPWNPLNSDAKRESAGIKRVVLPQSFKISVK